jgi:hypothetical protein
MTAIDAAGTAPAKADAVTSLQYSNLTATPSATAIVATVVWGLPTPGTIDQVAVTWGGQKMQLLGSLITTANLSNCNLRADIYGLINPVPGNQALSVGGWSAPASVEIDAVSLSGTDISAAYSAVFTVYTSSGPGNSPQTLNVPTSPGNITLGLVCSDDFEVLNTDSTTQLYLDNSLAFSSSSTKYAASSGTSTAFSWSDTSGTFDAWIAIGVDVGLKQRATQLAFEIPAIIMSNGAVIMSNFQLLNDEIATVTIKATNQGGLTEPLPSGDVFTVVSSKPASLTAAIGKDAGGNPAVILTPLVQASLGLSITVTDSSGLKAATLGVDISQDVRPANIVLDVVDATFTSQPTPTAPGP